MPGVTWWTSSEGGHVPSGGKERSNTQEKPAGKAAAQFVPVAFDAISARRCARSEKPSGQRANAKNRKARQSDRRLLDGAGRIRRSARYQCRSPCRTGTTADRDSSARLFRDPHRQNDVLGLFVEDDGIRL